MSKKISDDVLVYKYEFIPKELFSRLIVRLGRYAKDTSKIWKTGALLTRENTLALITQEFGSNNLEIKVLGDDKKEFMTIISEDLDVLNSTYDNLEVEKLIPCNCGTCIQLEVPNFYDYDALKKRLKREKFTIECENSYDLVDVQKLISNVFIKSFGSKKIPQNIKKEVLELIKNGELEKIWSILDLFYRDDLEFILLMSRWKEFKQAELKNILDHSQGQIEKEKIKYSILTWVDEK